MVTPAFQTGQVLTPMASTWVSLTFRNTCAQFIEGHSHTQEDLLQLHKEICYSCGRGICRGGGSPPPPSIVSSQPTNQFVTPNKRAIADR